MASGMPADSPRSSTDSESPLTSPASAQGLSGSNSQLVLLPNTEDREPYDEYASEDEDENEDSDDPRSGITSTTVPPLPPSVVFLYLLSPYLRLGAISILDLGGTSLTYSLASLAIAAFLSAFCRQIWFLLARYLRKSTIEDIFIHTFTRRRRRGETYTLARCIVATISGLFRLLLAALYLRDAVDCALSLIPETAAFRSRLTVSVLLSIVVFGLSLPKSLATKTMVYTTGLSVASYVSWLVVVCRSYGVVERSPSSSSWIRRGVLWNETSSIAFACTTILTVPLSASLMSGLSTVTPASKNQRERSFQLVNVFSAALGALLMLPLLIIAASPPSPTTSPTTPNNIVLLLRMTTLVLSIPPVILSIPSLPGLRGLIHRFTPINPALFLVTIGIITISVVPPPITSILEDTTLFLAVSGNFLLPALAHITIHYFRRPLSIVVPQAPSSAPSTPGSSNPQLSRPPTPDPLLQRKERHLQRRRLGKRIFWDIGIWIILLPVCSWACVWAAGRLARKS